MKTRKLKNIVEKKLGIPPDYQFNAIRSKNFIQSNWHKNKLHIAENLIGFNKKMEALDLGTGSGNFEFLFYNKLRNITGVDYNDEALKFLSGQLKSSGIKNVNLILSDIRDLHTKKLKKYDLIVMIDVIEHLYMKDVKVLFKNFFYKHLKKDGRVLIITPNYKSFWPVMETLFDTFALAPKFKDEQHLSKFHHENMQKIISNYNYSLDKITSFNFISYLLPDFKLSKKLCLWETKLPLYFGNLLAVTFSKK